MLVEKTVTGGQFLVRAGVSETSAPSLILLHGVTRRWQDFLTFLPALTPRWQIFAPDFFGHGGSNRRPGRYRVIDYAEDFAAFLGTRPAEPVVIYGHSLGALVAVAVAARLPGVVRALVLEDPPAPALFENLRASSFHALFEGMRPLAGDRRPVVEIARSLADVRVPVNGGEARLGDLRDATSLRFSARCLADLDPEVLTTLLEERWMEGYDVEPILSAVTCPVLLLRADDQCGGMLPRRTAEEMAARMKDCTLIDLPGTGHLLHWMATETVIRLTVGFLESLEPLAREQDR